MIFVNHNNLATLYNVVDSDLLWLNCIVLEIVNNPDPEYLKEREALYIRKFDTKRNGLNKSY